MLLVFARHFIVLYKYPSSLPLNWFCYLLLDFLSSLFDMFRLAIFYCQFSQDVSFSLPSCGIRGLPAVYISSFATTTSVSELKKFLLGSFIYFMTNIQRQCHGINPQLQCPMTYSPTKPRDSMSTRMSCLDTNWDLTPWVVHKATKIGKEVSSLPELELTAKSVLVDYFWIGIAISSSLLTFCACIFQRHRGKSGSFVPCFFFWSS